MCYDNIVRDLGAITTAIKVTSKTFVSHSKSTSPEILLYTLTIQWLRVSLESNPGLISTPGVEFWNFGCRILQFWNFGVEFSI